MTLSVRASKNQIQKNNKIFKIYSLKILVVSLKHFKTYFIFIFEKRRIKI